MAALRARKHREDKPFALMVAGLAAAHALVELGPAEEELLRSVARPIVLARRRAEAPVAAAVAPASRELGVMLPYSPLHHLLLADAGCALVLTSGNVSDEPIAYRDEDALARLAPIADAFLVHDRPIHMRTDDSVARVVRGRPRVLRRSRGFVPESLALPVPCTRHVLACGAELKSTFCLARGPRAWIGHHIGDLGDAETVAAFREGIAHFQRLFAVRPEVVAHDLHPDYRSTAYALEREGVAAGRRAAPPRPPRRLPGRARGESARRLCCGLEHEKPFVAQAVCSGHSDSSARGVDDYLVGPSLRLSTAVLVGLAACVTKQLRNGSLR